MNSESKAEDALYAAARHLVDPAARAAFLDAACAGNPALRERLERLLSAGPEADDFFRRNAVDLNRLPPRSDEDATVVTDPTVVTDATVVTPGTGRPGECIGRYKLLQPLGEGGMGAVWMAEQREPMVRRVALKIIKLGMDTREVIARFEAERQALAMMDHPCIARVFDAGTTESGRPFFVMELVRGVPLTAYCDEQKLGVRERLALFIQVCQAIQHAHQKGIIHRDLKPSNILVTAGDDSEPLPKVIDFGIAKATGQALTDRTLFTQLAQIIGTPAYMSPEQAGMGPLDIDTRSDIYSLGVLLYELLTGRPPFDPRELVQAGLDEMRRVIREQEPPRPSTRISSLTEQELTGLAAHCSAPAPRLVNLVRGDLDWIVMKALDKNRNRRYESATGLAADIQRHLQNQPVVARPPGAGYLLSRFVKRHKFGFAAGTAVALALVGGITAATWGLMRAETARIVAEEESKKANAARRKADEETAKATAANVENKKNLHLASMADFASALKAARENFDAGLRGERAVGFAGKSRSREAVALLTRSLEREPENRHSALCLHEILRHHPTMKNDCPITLCKHEGGVTSARFSPDGSKLVTAGRDHTARLWDSATGQAFGPPMRHDNGVVSASFSPDGTRVVTTEGVTAGADMIARVWNALTGAPVGTPMRHAHFITSASFSPDGTRIFTTGLSEPARIWDAMTGEPVGERLRHYGQVRSASFSPDGTMVVTAGLDQTMRLWDAATGNPIGQPLRFKSYLDLAKFSPGGTMVVTVSGRAVQLWDTATLKAIGDEMRLSDPGNDADLSPDGTRIVTRSDDQTVQVWDLFTRQPVGDPMLHLPPTPGSHFTPVPRPGWSPDGTRIVTVDLDQTVQVWDATTGKSVSEPMRHDFRVQSAGFTPDGTMVFTVGNDEVRMWNITAFQVIGEPLRHDRIMLSATFSPAGTEVVTAGFDKTARVWDEAAGQVRHALTPAPMLREIFQNWDSPPEFQPDGRLLGCADYASFSPDGGRVVSVNGDAATLWDLATGKAIGGPLRHDHPLRGNPLLFKLLNGERLRRDRALWSARFSPDGTKVVTTSVDNTARVWDAKTGHALGEPMVHRGQLYSSRFSPDGTVIATASYDTVSFWIAETGKVLGESIHCSGPIDVTFSPDGTKVVTANYTANLAQVWDVASRSSIGAPMRHDHAVMAATFSPNARMVVTASLDSTARVWDATTGQVLSKPMRHSDGVVGARFSPDGTMVVTASDDHSARVWDAATGHPLGEPMPHEERVYAATFDPGGRRIVTTSPDGTARLWEVPAKEAVQASGAITPGLPAWAKALAGLRFRDDGEFQSIPDEERRAVFANPELPPGPWADLAKWINTPAPRRTIDMKSRFSLRQIAERERDFNGDSLESLKSALKYDPTVPLARLFLATAMEEKENIVKAPKDRDPGLPQRAAFLRRYDLDALAREEGKMKKEELAALWVRAAKHLLALPPETKIGVGPKPTTAREEALQAARISVTLAPGDAAARELVKKAEAAQ